MVRYCSIRGRQKWFNNCRIKKRAEKKGDEFRSEVCGGGIKSCINRLDCGERALIKGWLGTDVSKITGR